MFESILHMLEIFCSLKNNFPVADLGGLGGCSPPLTCHLKTYKRMDVLKTYYNTLILANSDVLYISMHSTKIPSSLDLYAHGMT